MGVTIERTPVRKTTEDREEVNEGVRTGNPVTKDRSGGVK